MLNIGIITACLSRSGGGFFTLNAFSYVCTTTFPAQSNYEARPPLPTTWLWELPLGPWVRVHLDALGPFGDGAVVDLGADAENAMQGFVMPCAMTFGVSAAFTGLS